MPRERKKREFEQRVVEIARVTRVVKGGKRMRFRALVVIGNQRGRIGMGLKKGTDVSEAIAKAVRAAEKSMMTVPLVNGTIPHRISSKFKGAVVMLKPAQEGVGVIAGGSVRPVLELAGVHNIVSKSMGSSNKIANVRATILALTSLKRTTIVTSANAVDHTEKPKA